MLAGDPERSWGKSKAINCNGNIHSVFVQRAHSIQYLVPKEINPPNARVAANTLLRSRSAQAEDVSDANMFDATAHISNQRNNFLKPLNDTQVR